jgi:trk system potassium uptake protein TrkA
MLDEIAVVGLDAFGYAVAVELARLGHPVLAIDKDPTKVNSIRKQITHAIEADISQQEVLREIGLKDVNYILVSLGNDFQTSLLTTFILKELGAKFVLVKAEGAKRRKILKLAGADVVIQPENDIAEQTANFIHYSRMIDYMEIDQEHDVVALKPPKSWISQSIYALNCQNKFNVHILAVLNRDPTGRWQPIHDEQATITPQSILLVMGQRDHLSVIQRIK